MIEGYLLWLYAVSTQLFTLSLVGLPLALGLLIAKDKQPVSKQRAHTLILFLIAGMFGSSCFIPLVIPENHHYDIVPNVGYAFLCLFAVGYNLRSIFRDRHKDKWQLESDYRYH